MTAYFDGPDEDGAPLFLAIGRAVLAVSTLEKMLLLEIARLLVERNPGAGIVPSDGLDQELARLEGLTAGLLLRELRRLDLSVDLDERIGDVIDRRNEIVHHLMEDPQVVRAMSGDGMDAVVDRIERIALYAAELAVELQIVAGAKLEALLGKSQTEMVEIVKSVDPKAIEGPRERNQVEAVQALVEIEFPMPPQA
jgi:hypothetical protein